MTRRSSPGADAVGALLLLGLALVVIVYVIKWMLITAAVLVLPFAAWWLYDRAGGAPQRPAAD